MFLMTVTRIPGRIRLIAASTDFVSTYTWQLLRDGQVVQTHPRPLSPPLPGTATVVTFDLIAPIVPGTYAIAVIAEQGSSSDQQPVREILREILGEIPGEIPCQPTNARSSTLCYYSPSSGRCQ